jgi:hypothetical protein
MGLPVRASQMRAVLSLEAETTRWLSGLNSAHSTLSMCCSRFVTVSPV